MKRFLILMLCLALCMGTVGCGSNGTGAQTDAKPKPGVTVDEVRSYITSGAVPECGVSLGGVMGDVRAAYLGKTELTETEDGTYSFLSDGISTFCTQKEDFALVALWTTGDCFKIPVGVSENDIIDLLGTPVSEATSPLTRLANANGTFTNPHTEKSYTMAENTFVIYFENGAAVGFGFYQTAALAS